MKNALKHTVLTAILAAVCVFGTSASAAIIHVDYTGTVSSGYDSSGIFGTADTDLTGMSFYAKFIFDTTAAGYAYNSPTSNYVFGGSAYGVASPSLGATLSINGQTASVDGGYYGTIAASNDGSSFSHQYHDAAEIWSEGSLYQYDFISAYLYGFQDGGLPALIDTAFSVSSAGYSYSSNFQFSTYDYSTDTYSQYAFGYLDLETLTVSVEEVDVPEPSSLALLGLSLLMVVGMRRGMRA